MNAAATETAAQWLVAARREGRPRTRLPESCRPTDCAAAHAIQFRVTQLLDAPIGGWKCSVGNETREPAAPIHATAISRSSPCAVPTRNDLARIEPEIAFVLGHDLPPRATPYPVEEVAAAIVETRLVLELLGSRIEAPGPLPFAESLADGLVNFGLHVGPVISGAPGRSLESFALTIATPSGTLLQRAAVHPDRHPLRPLVWLANWLATGTSIWRTGLARGQIVTTGSYAGAIEVPVGQPLAITFGDLGRIDLTLTGAT